MSAVTTVVLVRHATHGHLGRLLTGRSAGVPLAAAGRQEAERLAVSLRGEAVAGLFTSPAERARETAAPIAAVLGFNARISGALNEIDFGQWTGASFSALAADPRWERWNRERAAGCPPGGEPMADVQARAVAQLHAWQRDFPDGRVVAVSHADVIKAALCHVLGLSLDRHATFDIEPASCSTIVLWPGGGKVLNVNMKAAA